MRYYQSSHPMATTLHFLVACLSCLKGAKGAATPTNSPPNVIQQPNAPVGVPDYVIKYAPLVYLDPTEAYLPADIGSQLKYCTPKLHSAAPISGATSPLSVANMDGLNAFGPSNGTGVYLTSNDDVATVPQPQWLGGVRPDSTGKTGGAISSAVIVADKGNGLVDAFYFYFYAFDDGGIVLGMNLGNHIGDWEHNMVRFQNGVPQAVWYSQHSAGQAFKYSVVLKDAAGLRPIVFSGNGTHANYGLPGTHDHTIASFIPGLNLPGSGIITDQTGYGALWDPIKSAYWYSFTGANSTTKNSSPTRFNSQVGTFKSYDESTSPSGWLYYQGRWGDEQYPTSDSRQKDFLGEYRYVTGPNGPAYKNLVRKNVWPGGTGVLEGVLLP